LVFGTNKRIAVTIQDILKHRIMKILRKLFHLSLLVLLITCVTGTQLNIVAYSGNTDIATQFVNTDHRPDGDVEGVWEPSGRLALTDHRPDGDVEGVWEPSGRLALTDHRPDGDVEGVWEPSGRLA